jgi:hypothetical protein
LEKGFRTVQCPGCPAKLRFPVSEKDYETTKTIRCPKCSTIGRVKIPRPAINKTKKPESSDNTDPSKEKLFDDLFGGLFNEGRKP